MRSPRRRPLRRTTDEDRTTSADASIPVDVIDRPREYLVTADLPGLDTQAIDLRVRKDKLQIVADFGDDAGGTYRHRERERGVVNRVIQLPERIDENRVTASYDAGILRVRLRKRDRSR